MANIFEFLSKDGNITPEKARKSRQMQFRDKIAYVWGLRYRWDPSLSRNLVPRTLCHPAQWFDYVGHKFAFRVRIPLRTLAYKTEMRDYPQFFLSLSRCINMNKPLKAFDKKDRLHQIRPQSRPLGKVLIKSDWRKALVDGRDDFDGYHLSTFKWVLISPYMPSTDLW